MKIQKLLFILLLFILTLTTVDAVVQSKPGFTALKSKTASQFFQLIREAEMDGGALGLSATFAEVDGAYTETSASNNIDAHMMKNTEWGVVAMLSASSYGAGNGKVQSTYTSSTNIYNVTASTTGNMTGVFGMHSGLASYEYMAAGIKSKMNATYNKYLINAKNRYVDSYADGSYGSDFSRYIPGDATYETESFGNAGSFVHSKSPVFKRGVYGVMYANDNFDSLGNAHGSSGSRLVVWSGAGL